MTEEEAIATVERRFDRNQVATLHRFVHLLLEESKQQNLIAASTADTVWSRHILDSTQLIDHAPATGIWVDVGSGGGLPGVVVGTVRPGLTVLLEPRGKRATFLADVAETLGLSNVRVLALKSAAYLGAAAAAVSARAVGAVETIFRDAQGFADLHTHFVLPRGRSAASDLAIARRQWQGTFHVKPSVTSDDAGILVATGVKPR